MELEALAGDPPERFARPIFGHCGGRGVEFAREQADHHLVDEDARNNRLRLALGKLELGVLKFGDRLAERAALPDIIGGDAHRLLHLDDAVERDRCPLPRKLLHQLVETPAFLAAEKIVVRSEEHTSELQSLMRISYAVFCL